MKYKYIFLDLDDTIWDFHANAKLSLLDMYQDRGLERYFDNFESFFEIYAKRNIELWEQYGKGEITKEFLMAERFRYPLAKMGVDDLELAEQIGEQYLNILPTKTALIPYAQEMLDELTEKKYPLTIISNGFVEVQYKKLRSSGIEHYFKHVVLSEAAQALKPDKRIFEYAMQLIGASSADECVMIGDSYHADIVGAQNAGIDQVYLFNRPDHRPENYRATYQVNGLDEIIPLLGL